MRWDTTWECDTILAERIPVENLAMGTWITRTTPITGQNAASKTSQKQRKAVWGLPAEVGKPFLQNVKFSNK